MKKLETKVNSFNKAYQHFKVGIDLIRQHGYKTDTISVLVWRIEKTIDELNKELLKEMQKEITEEEFKNIIKKFKK